METFTREMMKKAISDKLRLNFGCTAEEKEKYTKCIIDSSQKLNVLVSNILKISKIDNQKIIVEKEKFELDEQIREEILLLEKEWTKNY